ncbi:hypothetical protein IR073_06615 [Gemella sp. 19428wG2_WT2a]|nr:hypothetical protein [Gemella sp. 19428wG2_WT2a]TFU57707.1 hypothetical protein E4T67_06540 [Gemella sp. WT2a]
MLKKELINKVLDWADDKDALNEFIYDKQLMKVGEEVNELCTELVLTHKSLSSRGKVFSEAGDVIVTLIISDYLHTKDRDKTLENFLKIKFYTVKGAKHYTDLVLDLYIKYTDILFTWNMTKKFNLFAVKELLNTLNRIVINADSNLSYALSLAIEKNSKRTGKIVNGSFVKDEY